MKRHQYRDVLRFIMRNGDTAARRSWASVAYLYSAIATDEEILASLALLDRYLPIPGDSP